MHLCAHSAELLKARTYTVASLLLLSLRRKRPAFPNQKEMSVTEIVYELFITFGITSQCSSGFGKMYIFWEIPISFARVTLFQSIHLMPHRIR